MKYQIWHEPMVKNSDIEALVSYDSGKDMGKEGNFCL